MNTDSLSDGPFRLGVWLELQPDVHLSSEGIYRMLSHLLNAACNDGGLSVVIACASWTTEDVALMLQDYAVSRDHVDIVPSRKKIPIYFRLKAFFKKRRPEVRPPAPKNRLLNFFIGIGSRIVRTAALRETFGALLGTSNWLIGLLWVLVAAALFVALLPVLLIVLLICGLSMGRSTPHSFAGLSKRLWEKLTSARPVTFFASAFRAMFSIPLQKVLVRLLLSIEALVMEREYRKLARKLNRRTDITVWYIPHPAASHAASLTAPLVLAVPDIVYADFPTLFPPSIVKRLDRRIRTLAPKAVVTVSYSAYVRDEHVVGYLGVDPARARVIHHGCMDVTPYLGWTSDQGTKVLREKAVALVRQYLCTDLKLPRGMESLYPEQYVRQLPLDEIPFLFVSSRIRPHKNCLGLIKAFERVLRRRYMNLKLVLTGDMDHAPMAVKDYIRNAHLELDVLSIPNLPPDVHAAFYVLARLTVVPTLFEGGFPFLFEESMSVGTPVVMSSLPVTIDTVPHDLASRMLFDPYDTIDMANKIEWAVKHRADMFAMQRPLFESMKARTWGDVAKEYLVLLKEASLNANRL